MGQVLTCLTVVAVSHHGSSTKVALSCTGSAEIDLTHPFTDGQEDLLTGISRITHSRSHLKSQRLGMSRPLCRNTDAASQVRFGTLASSLLGAASRFMYSWAWIRPTLPLSRSKRCGGRYLKIYHIGRQFTNKTGGRQTCLTWVQCSTTVHSEKP
jgi:hypothetical protein